VPGVLDEAKLFRRQPVRDDSGPLRVEGAVLFSPGKEDRWKVVRLDAGTAEDVEASQSRHERVK